MPSYPASTSDSGGKVDLIIIRSRPYNNKVKRAVPDPHQLQHLGKKQSCSLHGHHKKVSPVGQREGESALKLYALESSTHYSFVLRSKVRKEMPSHSPTLPTMPEADRFGPEVIRERELAPPLISCSTQENVLGRMYRRADRCRCGGTDSDDRKVGELVSLQP